MKLKENAVTTKKENLPSTIDLESMEGQGNEFVTARDTKLPIIKIIYQNSPVLDDKDPRFVEGVLVSMIFGVKHLVKYGKLEKAF